MKQGSKLRRKLKACCLFRPTYCLPLVRCQRWLSPGLNDRGKGKRNSCGKFLQRKAFGGSETRVFLCFKAISKDDYVLEGGNVALSLSRFWEEISPGVYNIEDKRPVHFPEGENRGRQRNICSLKLVILGGFRPAWEFIPSVFPRYCSGPQSISLCFPVTPAVHTSLCCHL